MKIVVVGGTGLIGKKVVSILQGQGHEAVAASPSRGINALTGEGLAEALAGAQVVVDVTNAPSFEENAVREFFETSTRNLLAAEAAAGVSHHVVLSIVGTDRSPTNGYFRAKLAQEHLIAAGDVPYTIIRATQFFEFIQAIADLSTQGQITRLPSAKLQPMAADDVAAKVACFALAAPAQGFVEIAGPDKVGLDDLARRLFGARGINREVVTDESITYFGAPIDDTSLTPVGAAHLGSQRFDDWLRQPVR